MGIGRLREALDELDVTVELEECPGDKPLEIAMDAARELLTIREAGALIIVPDEKGKWPAWATGVDLRLATEKRLIELLDALRDAIPPEDTK